MKTQPLIAKPGDRGPSMSIIGGQITVLASDADKPDQQVTVQSGGQGFGPPPHSHAWDESFYVVKGEVEFKCGDQAAVCAAGTFVHIPGGTIHAFSFGPDGAEILEITGAGSNAVAMFTALDREVPPGPPDFGKVISIMGEHGAHVQA